MKLTRRALVLGAMAVPIGAQAWPPSNIRVVVAYPPGGSSDAIMRLVQVPLQERLGTAPYLIATSKAKPFQNLKDVIEAAKRSPGTISYASVGSGSVGHLAMTLLAQRAGVKLVHVPYRGGGPAMTDALGGHVDLLVGSTALSMPQVNTGNLRALAQTGKTRNQFLTQVPTVIESGFPDFEAYAWWGIFAPAGTPKPIIEKFGKALADTLGEERISKQLVETQQVTLLLGGPGAEREFLAKQMQIWGKVAKDNDIKAD